MKKKTKVVFTIAIFLFLISFIIVILPWSIMYIYSIFVPAPPYPQIKKEEFPFKLVYECDGKQRTIEDTLICEFAGMECDSNFKKHRTWTYKLGSGQDTIVLWTGENDKGEKQKICYEIGPEYYMGDDELCSQEEYPGQKQNERCFVEVWTYYDSDYGDIEEMPISKKKLLSKYGITLISWDCKAPIKNTFR